MPPIEDPAQTADRILHSNDAHSIANLLDAPGADTLKIIKEMQSQAKHLHMALPTPVIDGLAEHLIHEAKKGDDISNEYNMLSGSEKKAVAQDMVHDKNSKITIAENPKGELADVTVEIGPGVTRQVYQPEDGKHKIIGIVKKKF